MTELGGITRKRGYGTMLTGTLVLLLGAVITLITSVQGSTSALAVVMVIAGLVTWLVGVGRRRERT